jgi:hypothetical protein
MQNTKIHVTHVCDCTQCPEYKVLIDIPWKMIIEQKKFNFPVGFCKSLEKIIQDFSDIPIECKLDTSIKNCE